MSQRFSADGNIDRRKFLQLTTATGGVWAATSARRRTWASSPNQRLNVAHIGLGGMGSGHHNWTRQRPDLQVVALCDVDAEHLKRARALSPDAFTGVDFRDIIGRDDVDAVMIATPDHWHSLVAIAAARAGKQIYCEKPLANSIGEGRAAANAVQQSGVVLQTGCHERSSQGAMIAKQIVATGRLGDIKRVIVRLPNTDGHLQEVENFNSPPPNTEPPASLDYNLWLGHTPTLPYNPKRCHFWWRFHSNYGGGEMTDRGAHVIDLAHYLLDLDDTGPVNVTAAGKRPMGDFYDAFITFQFENQYANGLTIVGNNTGPRGLTLVGTEGRLSIAVHGCALSAEPASLLEGFETTGQPNTHRENWLAAISEATPVVAPVEAGHRTASVCHLNNIAMRLGKSLTWNPQTEKTGDPQANAMLTPTMRLPWSLDG